MLRELARVAAHVDRPRDDVWRVLTDFGHPQVLAPGILRCEINGDGVGAVRTVRSSRGLTIYEELLECDPATGRFRYRVLDRGDMPFAGIASYECTVTAAAAPDGGTTLSWRSMGAVDGAIAPIAAFLVPLYRGATANIGAHLRAR